MPLKTISPQLASELMSQGAVLVDIRTADEHARERIATAIHVPMERLRSGGLSTDGGSAMIFHCRSGNRTRVNASALEACTTCDGYLLEGGLDAWKKAGLPVVADASQPMELQRQVQITAGSLIVLGAVLGATASLGSMRSPALWARDLFSPVPRGSAGWLGY